MHLVKCINSEVTVSDLSSNSSVHSVIMPSTSMRLRLAGMGRVYQRQKVSTSKYL